LKSSDLQDVLAWPEMRYQAGIKSGGNESRIVSCWRETTCGRAAPTGAFWGNLTAVSAIPEVMTDDSQPDDTMLEAALRRVRDGDVAAFSVVVRRFERPLRAWLAAQSPPGVDVDEIAQRSFVAAYTRLGDYEAGTNFSAWLFTIARYQLKTETTRLRRIADYHTRYAPDLLQRELERRNAEPPEILTRRIEHLKACLETLGEHLRQFVTWRYVEEIPLEEMAVRSERSVPAVKKQLWLLRQKLLQCVEARLAAEGERS
jgi:RNA polymerase sigma-70 factor (ECF subfamily)